MNGIIKHDIYAGIIRMWTKFAMYGVIILFGGIMALSNRNACNIEDLSAQGMMLFNFVGCTPMSDGLSQVTPMMWVVIQSYIAYIIATYPLEDMRVYGINMMVRSKSRTKRWIVMKIEIKNGYKKIGKAEVLKSINLTFEGGKIYGLRGKNGSGKTMLMRAISGLITLTEGEIIIDGKKLGKDISFPESIGVLIENPSFIDEFSEYRNLKALADINHKIDEITIKQTIADVGLDPNDKKKYKKYSLGMKQRLGIAAAIMEKPSIILLDEPINAIDENGVEEIRQLLFDLKNEERIIIIACHDREELELLSDEIIQLSNGSVVEEGKAC